MARARRKLTKKESGCVGRKISIIKRESPRKKHSAVVGKAIGICKRKSHKKARK